MTQPRFYRYTNLPALIYLLSNRAITLLDPQTWDDKNDSHFLAEYKKKRKLCTVLGLCFAQALETYHHWHVYSGGSSGVRIQFDEGALLGAFRTEGKTIRHGPVKYLSISDLKASKRPTVSRLPFLKRIPFKDEQEYRVIYEHQTQEEPSHDVGISLDCIRGITLSPWMPTALRNSTAKTLKSIPGCDALEISRSTLISNRQWRDFGSNIR